MNEANRMQLLGQRIRQARENLGLSQERLAHRWGKKQYQISEYENGKRRIYAHDLPQLADALRVPIPYFFQDDIGLKESNVLEETLIDTFRSLRSETAQESAIKILQELRNMVESGLT